MLTRDDLRTVLIEALTGATDALRNAHASDPPSHGPARPDAVGTTAVTVNGKLALDVREAAEVLGIGRSKLYDLLRSGQLREIRVGSRVLVPAQALVDFVASVSDD